MKRIPEATAIILTDQERAELEGFVRSTKMDHRLRQRAESVLLAADGMATAPIAAFQTSTSKTKRFAGEKRKLLRAGSISPSSEQSVLKPRTSVMRISTCGMRRTLSGNF